MISFFYVSTYNIFVRASIQIEGNLVKYHESLSKIIFLGVAAVAGVFILLGVGMIVGCLILILEHLFYKYTLPVLRHQPKGTIWRSRNIMFFSQVFSSIYFYILHKSHTEQIYSNL